MKGSGGVVCPPTLGDADERCREFRGDDRRRALGCFGHDVHKILCMSRKSLRLKAHRKYQSHGAGGIESKTSGSLTDLPLGCIIQVAAYPATRPNKTLQPPNRACEVAAAYNFMFARFAAER